MAIITEFVSHPLFCVVLAAAGSGGGGQGGTRDVLVVLWLCGACLGSQEDRFATSDLQDR